MPTNSDPRPTHRTAVLATVAAVYSIRPDDLRRPTPCAGWNLLDLLAHMTVQHRGFAAAARGTGDDPSAWDVAAVRDAVASFPADTYIEAADDVLEAFAADDILTRQFVLPDFGPGATFPGTIAIGFHLVDYVVHGWDVAATLRQEYTLPADVIDATLPLALAIPDGEFRSAPNVPFGPARSGSETGDLAQLLRHLGRDPQWNSTVTGA